MGGNCGHPIRKGVIGDFFEMLWQIIRSQPLSVTIKSQRFTFSENCRTFDQHRNLQAVNNSAESSMAQERPPL